MNSKFTWLGVTVKEVRSVQRPNKTDLVFVDVVDPVTFETSGQFMYMPEDRNEMMPRKGDVVDVYSKPGMYNGRASITFASIQPSKTLATSKAV
ncbi:hypothetical protein [Paenibacillus odorifer]|jgi:hypothetical protein|uniref:hypothetical protein n=1 Tax=Paenibacillus odorifer TaxID=189426 RepID=UPI00096CB87F|nr:hypothetical protein [Paenibacillus odorifer]OMD76576.1 hypothetical protein BSK50_14870 [Paenibacillus odorifer]